VLKVSTQIFSIVIFSECRLDPAWRRHASSAHGASSRHHRSWPCCVLSMARVNFDSLNTNLRRERHATLNITIYQAKNSQQTPFSTRLCNRRSLNLPRIIPDQVLSARKTALCFNSVYRARTRTRVNEGCLQIRLASWLGLRGCTSRGAALKAGCRSPMFKSSSDTPSTILDQHPLLAVAGQARSARAFSLLC